jgi:hypothetical protein
MNTEQAMILYKLRQIDTAAQIIREVHDVRVASEIAAWIESKADEGCALITRSRLEVK